MQKLLVNVASQHSGSSKYIVWQSKVYGLCGMATDATTKVELESLAEKLRFVASDAPGGSHQDKQVSRGQRRIK